VENTFMIEVMTPEQTARYIEITDPKFIAAVMEQHPAVRPGTGNPVENLQVIG
jgi:hypothetical protein